MAEPKMALENDKPVSTITSEARSKVGLDFKRYFTDGRVSPFDAVEWEKRTAQIGNEKGQVIFRQENVEVPSRGHRPRQTSLRANTSTGRWTRRNARVRCASSSGALWIRSSTGAKSATTSLRRRRGMRLRMISRICSCSRR